VTYHQDDKGYDIPTFDTSCGGGHGNRQPMTAPKDPANNGPQKPKSPARQQCEAKAKQEYAQEKSDAASDAVTAGALTFGAMELGFAAAGCAIGGGAGTFFGTTVAEFTGGLSSFGGAAVGCFTGGVDMALNGLAPSATTGLIGGGIAYRVGRHSATKRYEQRMQQCSAL
jgi:hypothetical protein